MTMKVLASGPEWGKTDSQGAYQGWPLPAEFDGKPVDEAATNALLGDLVVERFHQIASEDGSSASWMPDRAEVLAEEKDEQQGLFNDYEDWRQQAIEEVAENFTRGRIRPVIPGEPNQPYPHLLKGY